MHLIPVYIRLIAVEIGWRWEWAGALLFAGFGIWDLVTSWGPFPLVANPIGGWPIAGPVPLIALRCFKLGRTEKEPTQRHNRGLMIGGIHT
jgi:hypothetical protein